ncbi:MAG: iron-containing redox enzyme family protein [Gammaproteobacteria bacterium]|nr:iron-containing redox enzyme family protein [Gammaproteobacteria bacterium]
MQYLTTVRKRVLDGITATPIVASVLSGDADPQAYARYLTNVWHYAQHSSTVIGLAGSRCVAQHPCLAEYLLHHAQEELGHERWALDDLAVLGVTPESVRASRPVISCAAMIGYEYYVAGVANPVGLFGWLYVLEAMGDDLGGMVAKAIGGALQLDSGLKFLAGHGEADVEHTRDIVEQIDKHVGNEDLPDVHHVADVVADLYVRMFHELSD